MTTIRMVDHPAVEGKVREIFDAALRRERTVFGATAISTFGVAWDIPQRCWRRIGSGHAR